MDIGSIIGLVLGFIMIILSILFNADMDIGAVGAFLDAPSLMIVLGGTVASALIATKIPIFLAALKSTKLVFMGPTFNAAESIESIVTLSNLARREGVLALEESASNMDDAFLKKGIMLVVDGADPELVRSVLETEMNYMEERHNEVRGVWESFNGLFPAWGMVGTMIGLVLMMANIQDVELLAAGMQVAIMTTLYGALFANFFALPISSKLKMYNSQEILLKEIQIEGMLSIQNGENPRIIEEKLKAFLAPSLRSTPTPEGGAGGGE